MTRLLCVLAALLAALAVLYAVLPSPDGKKEPLLYFPTKVGAEWVYQNEDGESVEVVTAVEDKGGATLVSVAHESRRQLKLWAVMAVSKDGLAVVSATGVGDLTEPFWVLKLPHKDGAKWDTVLASLPGTWRGTAVATGPEEVTVPAGTFRAIRVNLDTEAPGGHRVVRSQWFAPGVGVVKEEREGRTRVLKKFTPGKD